MQGGAKKAAKKRLKMAKTWRNCKIIGGLASGNSFELLLTAKWMVNIAELWLLQWGGKEEEKKYSLCHHHHHNVDVKTEMGVPRVTLGSSFSRKKKFEASATLTLASATTRGDTWVLLVVKGLVRMVKWCWKWLAMWSSSFSYYWKSGPAPIITILSCSW